MAVFAIISQPGQDAEKLPEAIERAFPQPQHYKLNEKTWVVSGAGTAREISDKLGISELENGPGVVAQLTGDYYGRADMNIWNWLKSAFEATDRG